MRTCFLFIICTISFSTFSQTSGTIKVKKKDPCYSCYLTLNKLPSGSLIDTATLRHITGPQIMDSTKCKAILERYELSLFHAGVVYTNREYLAIISAVMMKQFQKLVEGDKIYLETVIFDDLSGAKYTCAGSSYKVVNVYPKPVEKKKVAKIY